MSLLHNCIIAEIGSVHDGSLGNALKLIDLAKSVGADAVKFQTHFPEFEVTVDSPRPSHFSAEDRATYFSRTGFSRYEWETLFEHAQDIGISFLSSAFSVEAATFLDGLGVEVHKIASGEVTNRALISQIAESGKPTLLSTGMSDWAEVEQALQMLRAGSVPEITILQCTSMYPCPPQSVGLNVLGEIRERFSCEVGLSDHSFGPAASIASAALGASVIEKHLTFSRRMYGSDAPYAMEPEEFSDLSIAVREVWEMVAHPVDKNDLSALRSARNTFQAVVVAAEPLAVGHSIREEDLSYRKANSGLIAWKAPLLLGKTLSRPISALEPINFEDTFE